METSDELDTIDWEAPIINIDKNAYSLTLFPKNYLSDTFLQKKKLFILAKKIILCFTCYIFETPIYVVIFSEKFFNKFLFIKIIEYFAKNFELKFL